MLTPAVLFDAAATLTVARRRLDGESARCWLVLRRPQGLVVLWYLVPASDVRALESGLAADTTLADALSLARRRPTPVVDLHALDGATGPAIVLEGDELLGILEPEERPAAAAAARALPPRARAAARGGFGGLGGFAGAAPPAAARPDAGTRLATGAPRERDVGAAPAAPPRAGVAARAPTAAAAAAPAMTPAATPAAPAAPIAPAAASAAAPAAPTAPAAARAAAPAALEPFSAWPNVQAPPTVTPRQRFQVSIGLSSAPVAGVVGGEIRVALPAGTQRFPLEVFVVADGFEAPSGWRHVLDVDRDRPTTARCEIPLLAPAVADATLLAQIVVQFAYRGMPCGIAVRRIAVVPAGSHPLDEPGAAGQLWTRGTPAPAAMVLSADAPPPDLTVWICRPGGNPCSGCFAWTFSSPHAVALPDRPLMVDLGQDAAAFAQAVLTEVAQMDNSELIDEELRGLGADIAAKTPPEFFRLLREIAPLASAAGRRPTVLIETAETHVPWELALMDEPLDAARPPFLGCQVAVARWILQQPGPPQPPAHAIEVRRMAVITAEYDETSGLAQLPMAVQEGQLLEQQYGAIPLKATQADVNRLLAATLPEAAGAGAESSPCGAEAVHFACHGEADPAHPARSAVMFSDGRPLNAHLLRSTRLGERHHPFLFLNACQVGTAGEQLGSFSGFAGSTLSGGFRAFLAPLWNVDDRIAHEFAREFYARVLGDSAAPEPVGSVLSDLRSRFVAHSDQPASATWLAYVFYGHPALRFSRAAV